MEEMNPYPTPYEKWPLPPEPVLPTGKRELRFFGAIVVISLLLADFILFGGFYLGFAAASAACIVCTAVYLLRSGCRLTFYSGALLALSLVICGSFLRSDDGFVKFVMVCFLLTSANLGLCLLAGQNRRSPAGIASLADAFRTVFVLGIGQLGAAFRGLNGARKEFGAKGKNRTAILVGIAVAVPVLAILIPLLMSADAAFEGLLDLLPEISLAEPLTVLFFGLMGACVLYTRGVALARGEKEAPAGKQRKTIHPLTVNTVLIAVCAVYGVYLFSQLAYFFGGFSGILPAEYTMAQYARRGFFEMAWLCAIDLAIMTAAVALTKPAGGQAPRLTRILCLIIGIMTLFFVAAASAKMFLYIGAYGLTRLRVLTEVIMVFLGIATAVVCIWLFVPKVAYMKVILLTGLVMGALTAWVDVDTMVAAYNVGAYQSGVLQQVDIGYLEDLSSGAVPYLQALTHDEDPEVVKAAAQALADREPRVTDIRSWNIAGAIADAILAGTGKAS